MNSRRPVAGTRSALASVFIALPGAMHYNSKPTYSTGGPPLGPCHG